jgi:2'-5' RNA ligase
MTRFRGFIAIDIGDFPKIIELENEVTNAGANVKLVEPKNIHITLKFLGDTEETKIDEIENIIKNAVNNVTPFKIQLRGTGVFPNPGYIKVIWIGIKQGEQIGIIADRIDEQLIKLGFEREKRKFSPHLTIARVKTAKNKEKLTQIVEKYRDAEFIDIKVDTIRLKKSELTPKGPIYTTLREIKIGGEKQ